MDPRDDEESVTWRRNAKRRLCTRIRVLNTHTSPRCENSVDRKCRHTPIDVGSSSPTRFPNSWSRQYKMQIENETFQVNSWDYVRLGSTNLPWVCPRPDGWRRARIFISSGLQVQQQWLSPKAVPRQELRDVEELPTLRHQIVWISAFAQGTLLSRVRHLFCALALLSERLGSVASCPRRTSSLVSCTASQSRLTRHFPFLSATETGHTRMPNDMRNFKVSFQHMWRRDGSGVPHTCESAAGFCFGTRESVRSASREICSTVHCRIRSWLENLKIHISNGSADPWRVASTAKKPSATYVCTARNSEAYPLSNQ